MSIVKQLPMLYGIASNRKIKVVNYYVEQLEDGTCDIVNEHGYLNMKQQTDRRNIKAGKNIGRSNETTIQEQAISEAESKWKKKLDSNYTENESGIPDESERSLLPMLAHSFDKRKHNIKYPCLVQPKLDGVRCMSRVNIPGDGSVINTSRKYKPYDTLGHIDSSTLNVAREIFTDPKNNNGNGGLNPPLDGEIYKHGLSLQEINRRVKKYREGDTEELEYWVYDIADTTLSNVDRNIILQKVHDSQITWDKSKVKIVPTYIAESEEDIKNYHDGFVQEGYEGVIIRNMDGKYQFDKRSADLQKYKEFQDDEFKIVGTFSGEGREEGAIIFQCEVKNPVEGGAKSFDVRPRGSIEDRRVMMSNDESYIDKELTVRYFALTEDNLPQFPVGITIREDL